LFGARVAVATGGLAVELLAGELEKGELGPDRSCRRWSFAGGLIYGDELVWGGKFMCETCLLWTDLGRMEVLYLL
jgi:hypothetical protein